VKLGKLWHQHLLNELTMGRCVYCSHLMAHESSQSRYQFVPPRTAATKMQERIEDFKFRLFHISNGRYFFVFNTAYKIKSTNPRIHLRGEK
jgi:hypothetical protein